MKTLTGCYTAISVMVVGAFLAIITMCIAIVDSNGWMFAFNALLLAIEVFSTKKLFKVALSYEKAIATAINIHDDYIIQKKIEEIEKKRAGIEATLEKLVKAAEEEQATAEDENTNAESSNDNKPEE